MLIFVLPLHAYRECHVDTTTTAGQTGAVGRSVSGCARPPWPMRSTFWQGHCRKKLNQMACRRVLKWSQRLSRNDPPACFLWQPVPHPSRAFLSPPRHRNYDVTLEQEMMTWHFSLCLDCMSITAHDWAQLSVTFESLKGGAECQHSVKVLQRIQTSYRSTNPVY